MRELKDNDLKKVDGGSVFAGTDNILLQCDKCKKNFLTRKAFAGHFLENPKHNKATAYEQKTKGKAIAGKKVGSVTASRSSKNVKMTYSNGTVKYVSLSNFLSPFGSFVESIAGSKK